MITGFDKAVRTETLIDEAGDTVTFAIHKIRHDGNNPDWAILGDGYRLYVHSQEEAHEDLDDLIENWVTA